MSLTPEEISLIKDSVAQASHFHDIAHLLKGDSDSTPSAAVRAVGRAFDYDEIPPASPDRDRWGPFGPMIESTSTIYPLPLGDVPSEDLATWEAAYEAIDLPLLRARLGDLLWVRRYGDNAYLKCRGAHLAYMSLVEFDAFDTFDRSQCAIRALELAREINASDLLESAIRKSLDFARETVSTEPGDPGAALAIAEAVTRWGLSNEPDQLPDLIDRLLAYTRDDPWMFSSAAAVALARATDQSQRSSIAREVVQAWRDAATNANSSLIRSLHLKRALDQATIGGLKAESEDLRKELQDLSFSSELEEIAVEVDVPANEIEEYIDGFIRDDLHTSLATYGLHCPLPESRDDTYEYVREYLERYPLQALVSQVVVGPLDMPLVYASTYEENFAISMHQHEARTIEFWGTMGVEILKRLASRHETSREELRNFFTTSIIEPTVADRFAESVELFMSGSYDSSLMTCLPRLETTLRELCRRLGLVIYTEPRVGAAGKFKTLGTLLGDLAGVFDDRSRRYFQALLVEPLSYNLRNNALHGLIPNGSPGDAALALHAACRLALFEVTVSEPE